jgi:hypothetical protein
VIIEELAKSKANSIPNFSLVKYYEAALPQYHMEAVLTMLKKKPLSVLQEFVLKFIEEGITDIAEIRTFLGINAFAINSAVATLQNDGMVSVDIFNSHIRITEKGEEALKVAATIVPDDIEYPIYVDGLLGNIYFDTKSLYSKRQVRDFDLTAISPSIDTPTIENIEYEEVKRALNSFKHKYAYEKDKLEGDLQEVAHVEKAYVEYKKASVLVFKNDKTDEIELQVYEGTIRNDEYGIALQKMYNDNLHVFDFDNKNEADESEELPLMNLLPEEIIVSAREYSAKANSIERDINNLQNQLTEMVEHSETEDEEQKESSTEKIRFLEKKIREMENERKGADRVLSTYDHRPLLLDALKNAKNSIIIISPWIKSSGLNNQILSLIEKAVQRKTRVVIGYGISEKEDSDKWIINSLNNIKEKKYGEYLELIRLSNTHEKVLIKDNEFMVITSFNWLSFKGDPKRGFRQETGFYTESKDAIAQMKENLSQEQRLGIKL